MSTTRHLKRVVAAALLSGVGAVATLGLGTLGLGTGTAEAEPHLPLGWSRCDPICHGQWCPGEPVPWIVRDLAPTWDMNVCHDYHQVSGGVCAEGPLPPGSFVCPPFAFLCP